MRLCLLLLCTTFTLLVLIAAAWRHYGNVIMGEKPSAASSVGGASTYTPETHAIRSAVLKKHR